MADMANESRGFGPPIALPPLDAFERARLVSLCDDVLMCPLRNGSTAETGKMHTATAELLRIARSYGHATWFFKINLRKGTSCKPSTHSTRVSMGTPILTTVACSIHAPDIESQKIIWAMTFAVNTKGNVYDRVYVTENFRGEHIKAHIDIDELPNAPRSLTAYEIQRLATKMAIYHGTTVSVARSTRGGSRIHVYMDAHVLPAAMAYNFHLYRVYLREIWNNDTISDCLVLDQSTQHRRSMRLLYAKSNKAGRDDYYEFLGEATFDGKWWDARDTPMPLMYQFSRCNMLKVPPKELMYVQDPTVVSEDESSPTLDSPGAHSP